MRTFDGIEVIAIGMFCDGTAPNLCHLIANNYKKYTRKHYYQECII